MTLSSGARPGDDRCARCEPRDPVGRRRSFVETHEDLGDGTVSASWKGGQRELDGAIVHAAIEAVEPQGIAVLPDVGVVGDEQAEAGLVRFVVVGELRRHVGAAALPVRDQLFIEQFPGLRSNTHSRRSVEGFE